MFKRAKIGLYYHNVSREYLNDIVDWVANKAIKNNAFHNVMQISMQYQGITTVAENRQNYSSQQFEQAKEAHKLYHNVGAPTVDKFKLILQSNMIKNCPVTIEDVDIAEDIWGKDIAYSQDLHQIDLM